LIVIALDRYRGILWPLKGEYSKLNAKVICLVVWIISVILASPNIAVYQVEILHYLFSYSSIKISKPYFFKWKIRLVQIPTDVLVKEVVFTTLHGIANYFFLKTFCKNCHYPKKLSQNIEISFFVSSPQIPFVSLI